MEKARYILNLLIATLLFLTVAVNRDGKILGYPTTELIAQEQSDDQPKQDAFRGTEDGMVVLHSKAVVEDVFGYGGETPLKIYLKEDRIASVVLEPNAETPSFLRRVTERGFLEQWNGLTLEEATEKKVDAVSGSTLSSNAITENVRRSAAHAIDLNPAQQSNLELTLKEVVALAVIALGVTINFIRPKKKWFRVVLFALNTTVLGAWCGSFLSLSMFTTWAANGISLSVAIIPVALLLVGIIMPLLGKKGAYCSHHCPLGAAQELLSLTKKKKLRIPTKIAKPLNRLRDLILAALLFVMWIGVGFSIMDYEIFSIFLIQSASTTVIVLSSIFLVLSIFIHRPYCRFVCPTGAILTLTQKTKQ